MLRLRGRLLADLRRALPASDPTRYPVFVGDRNCPERHGPRVAVPLTWKRRRPLLCVSLRLLAPAACRVPGGLIKFDLFSVKVYYPHLRWPGGLSSVLYGLGESRTASPRVPSCVQSRGRRIGGGGCSSAAGLQGAGIPGSCHAALAPNLPPKSRPSPLPFASLEPGVEPPREECVNFLTGGKLSSPGMGCFPAGSAGCAWLCLYIDLTKSEGPRFLSRGPVTRASVQRKEARKFPFFFLLLRES